MCGDQRKKVGELRQITDVLMLLFNGTVRCTSGGRAFSAVIIASLRLSPKQARARDRSHVCASRAFRRTAPHAAYALAQLFRGRGCHRRTAAAPHRTSPQTAFRETLQNFLAIDNVLVTAGILFTSRVHSPVSQWSQSQLRAAASHPPTISHPHIIRMQRLQIRIDKNFALRFVIMNKSGNFRCRKIKISCSTMA